MTPIVVGILVWTLIVLIAAFIAIIGCAFENLNNKKLSCLGTYMVQTAQIILPGCILFIFVVLIVTLFYILFSIFGG